MTDRILVTSALPYVNGIKHIGNLAGSILPADVYARFQRLRGHDVLFVCGTDEHGTPAELAALDAGLPVAEYCARQHAAQAEIYRRLDISFDYFGRSSSPANHALTRHLFRRLEANGCIEERVLQQFWSHADRRFLPDRYIVGTCPHCGDEAARGDQCDSCGRLLDPVELIAPRSALSGSTALETRETRHLFLLQSKFADRLRCWLDGKTDWDPLVLSLAHGLLDQGLRDRCITRDLAWGVPVPKRGWEGKVFYVWFDAPIAYVALTQEWAAAAPGRDWHAWWRSGTGTQLVQFLGKDNVAFHALTFPATILGSGADIRLVDRIKGFSWLTWGGDKFSTSRRRGIFLDAALDELPADWWRWWLTANAPEASDTRFTPTLFAAGCNADLADRLGNLVSRVLSFAATRFDGRVPERGEPGEAEARLAVEADAIVRACAGHFAAIRLRRACESLRALWSLCDRYFASQAPWRTISTDPDHAACTTRTAINLLRLSAVVASPVLPDTSRRIADAVGGGQFGAWPGHADEWLREQGGTSVCPPGVLFPRLPPDWAATIASRYGL
jgi:methionyl-tRNA synthetase